MEAAVERFRLKRADVLVASDRKTSSSPRAQSQVVPAGTSHPRFSWHANMQLPRERDKSSRAASSKTAEQNCRLHCRQNRRRPAPCRPPGPPLGVGSLPYVSLTRRLHPLPLGLQLTYRTGGHRRYRPDLENEAPTTPWPPPKPQLGSRALVLWLGSYSRSRFSRRPRR